MQLVAAPSVGISRHGGRTTLLALPKTPSESCTSATATIRQLGREQAWQASIQKIKELRSSIVQTDTVLHNSVVSSCERATRWAQALGSLAALQAAGLVADIASFGTVVSSTKKKTLWFQAAYYLEASRLGQLRPNVISYNTALNSAIRAMTWLTSIHLFDSLCKTGLPPSTITYNSIMMSYMVTAAWRRALAVSFLMRVSGIEADVVSLGVITTAYASDTSDSSHRAWEVCLLSLDSPGLDCNEVVINAALGGCAVRGAWKTACLLLRALQQASLRADSTTFSSASGSCSGVLEWESAVTLFQKSADQGVRDANLLDAAIRDATRASRWEKTQLLLHGMKLQCLRADAPRCKAALCRVVSSAPFGELGLPQAHLR